MGRSPTWLSKKPNVDTDPSTMKKKLEGAIKIRQKGQEFPANIELHIGWMLVSVWNQRNFTPSGT